jgi:hypothetical protein
MTHSMIGVRHGKAQIAMFLQDIANEMKVQLVATSCNGNETYRFYNVHTLDRVFSGSADDALKFLEGPVLH